MCIREIVTSPQPLSLSLVHLWMLLSFPFLSFSSVDGWAPCRFIFHPLPKKGRWRRCREGERERETLSGLLQGVEEKRKDRSEGEREETFFWVGWGGWMEEMFGKKKCVCVWGGFLGEL